MSITSITQTHVVRILRFTETRNATSRTVDRAWAEVEVSVAAEIQVRTLDYRDDGAGERVAGHVVCYIADASVDVQEGDVVDTISGPEHPLTMQVREKYTPRGHHHELQLEEWDGSTTGVST